MSRSCTSAASELWIRSLRDSRKNDQNSDKKANRRSKSEVPNLCALAKQPVERRMVEATNFELCNKATLGAIIEKSHRSKLLKASANFDFSNHYRSASEAIGPTMHSRSPSITSRSPSPPKLKTSPYMIVQNVNRPSGDMPEHSDNRKGLWTKLRISLSEVELSLGNLLRHGDDDQSSAESDKLDDRMNSFEDTVTDTPSRSLSYRCRSSYSAAVDRYRRKTPRYCLQKDREEASSVLKAAEDWRMAQRAIKHRQKVDLFRFCHSLMQSES